MYIRRKVFSLLEVDGEERYFSTTDFELEQKEFTDNRFARDVLKHVKVGADTPIEVKNEIGEITGRLKNAKKMSFAEKRQLVADLAKRGRSVKNTVGLEGVKMNNAQSKHIGKYLGETMSKNPIADDKMVNEAKETSKKIFDKYKNTKNVSSLKKLANSKWGKIGMIGAGTAAIGGLGYGAYKAMQGKKE